MLENRFFQPYKNTTYMKKSKLCMVLIKNPYDNTFTLNKTKQHKSSTDFILNESSQSTCSELLTQNTKFPFSTINSLRVKKIDRCMKWENFVFVTNHTHGLNPPTLSVGELITTKNHKVLTVIP